MSDPTPTEAQKIRRVLGDTDPENPLISDTEIADTLVDYPDWRLAAASIADSLAARALSDPTSMSLEGEGSISWTNRAKEWRELAKSLRAQVADETKARASGGVVSVELTRSGVLEEGEYRAPRRKRWI